MLYTFFQKNSKKEIDACEQINTVNKLFDSNEVYEQVKWRPSLLKSSLKISKTSELSREHTSVDGESEYFFQLNSWKSTQVNSIECCKRLCLITDVQVFFFISKQSKAFGVFPPRLDRFSAWN